MDNAANIQKAVREVLGWYCLGCFGHTINLCVKVGLKQHDVHTAVSRCSRLVTYFRKSTQASTLLANKQEALGMKKHKLLQDVDTRWNSTYDMIQRVMEQQAAICAALLEQKRMDLLPKDNELKLLEDIIDILKPFKDVTEQMSGQAYVTLSAVRPILHFLKSKVLQPLDSESRSVQNIKNEMRSNLCLRYQLPMVSKLLDVACFVDPRFKAMPFFDSEQLEELYQHVQDLLTTENIQETPVEVQEVIELDQEPTAKATTGIGKLLSDMYCKVASIKNVSTESQIKVEIERYRSEPSPHVDTNPLAWWKENEGRFPKIAL